MKINGGRALPLRLTPDIWTPAFDDLLALLQKVRAKPHYVITLAAKPRDGHLSAQLRKAHVFDETVGVNSAFNAKLFVAPPHAVTMEFDLFGERRSGHWNGGRLCKKYQLRHNSRIFYDLAGCGVVMVDVPQGNLDFTEIIARRMNKARNLRELAWLLERFMSECDVIEHHGRQTLVFKRARVDRVGAMSIEIYANEHAPPHFHVKSHDINATFVIIDCSRLNGEISARNERLIKLWHSGAKKKLIEIWNRTRPANCPVGTIPEG